jgi:hypothetical protein
MGPEQTNRTLDYNARVARLLAQARRRPLSPDEFKKLQGWLACMRMLCDTPYILDPDCRVCPKLGELEEILRECLAADGRKVLIFSEWERMLELVRELAAAMEVGFAWHTGSVPQLQRREEIRRFKQDPSCRLFLSTDSGSVGLNLQAASVVINLDLPWNPARLEQRIARAWRKHQPRSVQVIQLVTENSIEHRMLQVLASKQELAEGLLDGIGELDALPIPSGRAGFIERVEAIMGTSAGSAPAVATAAARVEPAPVPADPLERLSLELTAGLGDDLVLLEAHAAADGRMTLLAVVDRPSEVARRRTQLESVVLRGAGEGETPPRLELIDRTTYEAIERLAAAGLVQLAAPDRWVLYRSPQLTDPRAEQEQHRLHQARRSFDRAERKQRMARVLAEGGFPLEALPALTEALAGARLCLAHLVGAVDVSDENVSPAATEALRQAAPPVAELATEVLSLLARSSKRTEAVASVTEEDAMAQIEDGTRLLRRIEDLLGREATEAP